MTSLLSQTTETLVKWALSSCLPLFCVHTDTHTHTHNTSPPSPLPLLYMNIHQTAEGDVSLFFLFFFPAAAVVFLSAFLERWNFNDIADEESEWQKPDAEAA